MQYVRMLSDFVSDNISFLHIINCVYFLYLGSKKKEIHNIMMKHRNIFNIDLCSYNLQMSVNYHC